LFVRNDGNVGIGTTTPETLLHLYKVVSAGGTDMLVQNASTSTDVSTQARIRLVVGTDTASSASNQDSLAFIFP
jgi:hypothetical protein